MCLCGSIVSARIEFEEKHCSNQKCLVQICSNHVVKHLLAEKHFGSFCNQHSQWVASMAMKRAPSIEEAMDGKVLVITKPMKFKVSVPYLAIVSFKIENTI